MAIPTILRGEDTAARGRSLAITLPEGDYTGLTIRLQWCGLERSWVSPASGASLSFDLSARETLPIPLGTHMGRLAVIRPDGTGYIISETIRLRVTDDVAEATGADNAIEITPRDAAATLDIDLTGIDDEPATPDALRAAWKEFLRRMRAAMALGGVLLGMALTARAEGRIVAQTARSGSLPWGAEVVTNVTVEGGLGLDANDVTNIVTRGFVEGLGISAGLTTNNVRDIVADATNFVRRTGDVMTGPLTVDNGPSAEYPVSAFPVTISGSADVEGTGGLSWEQGATHKGHFVPVAGFAWEFFFDGKWIQLPFAKGGVTNTAPAVIAVMSDLDGFLETESDPVFEEWKPRRELHADMATNIVWKNVYSNGWVYLVPYSNNLEDAE